MAPTRGPTLLRARFKSFMEANLPSLIDVARDSWDLQDWQLPYPLEYAVYDPFKTERFPSIALTVQSDTDHTRTDVTDAVALEYMVQYATIISVVCRTPHNPDTQKWAAPHYDETLRLRDDMTKLVQALIKQTPNFGVQGVRLEETTINTNYQDAVSPTSQSPVFVATGTISVNILQQEFTYNAPLGTANTIDVDFDVVKIFEEMS